MILSNYDEELGRPDAVRSDAAATDAAALPLSFWLSLLFRQDNCK